MYTNNGTNYSNGLSENPHFSRQRAKSRIISSSVLLGIGAVIAYIGFIFLLVAGSFSTPYYDVIDIRVNSGEFVFDNKLYKNNSYEFFYSSNGGHFYIGESWGFMENVPYYYDGNGNSYKYNYSMREYYDESTGYSYRNYKQGNYESYSGEVGHYRDGNEFFYHQKGGYCWDNQSGTVISYDSYGNYSYFNYIVLYGYDKASDSYYTVWDGVRVDSDGKYFLKPGKFDFRAPEPDEVFFDDYGNYYRLDENGFYYCDYYGTPIYGYDDNSYYCIDPYYNNYDEYNAMMSVGTIMLIGGLGLTILEAILLSRAVKAFKASKRALRHAQGYMQYGNPSTRPAPAARRSFCTCCGTKADSDAVYCVNCGHRI